MRIKYSSFQYLTNLTPLLLMAGLLLFSFVLVKKSTPTAIGKTIKTTPNQHDYYLNQFFISEYDGSGKLKMYVSGDSALHLEKSAQMAIQNFNFHYANRQIHYQANSKSALIDDSGDHVKLFDKVKMLRSQ